MSKDPAFLFYPGDWLGGTLGMTFEEKGAYMELLMLQFNRGHMTSHMIGQVVGQLWVKIHDKFVQDDKGLWYNVRLEVEINKRKIFINSRNNNLKGINQYSKKEAHMGGHVTSHMENENENNDKGGTGGKKETDRSVVIYDAEELKKELLNSHTWKTQIRAWNKGMSEKQVDDLIVRFIQELQLKDDLHKSIGEYRRHFINWLKFQKPQEPEVKILNPKEAIRKINADCKF